MAEAKTKPTKQSVPAFLKKVPDPQTRADAAVVIDLMQKATKQNPVMWGPSIIGFGSQRYKYASGREGDWPIIALSPRKQNLVLYLMPGPEEYPDELKKLGPHTTGKSCLYLKRLADIDMPTLKRIVTKSIAKTNAK